jgi:glycolate oxidase FAD binding subunit
MTVKAGTPISEIKKQLKKNNQALSFYTDNDDMSIGAVYANGAQDISDSVLGVQIIEDIVVGVRKRSKNTYAKLDC